MAMPLDKITEKARLILIDPSSGTYKRWEDAELVGWVNDSYLALITMRPDIGMTWEQFTCTADVSEQAITVTGAIRLHSVLRNDESGDKSAIQLVSQSLLDTQHPEWRNDTTVTEATGIQFYMHDPLLPLKFSVYPVPTTARKLWVAYVKLPTLHSTASAPSSLTLLVPDHYAEPILNYVLYRAFSKDMESTSAANRAASHYQLFASALGAGVQSDTATAPKN